MSDDDIESIRERKREELLERATTPDEPVHVADTAHLRRLVADHGVVLVDFYADWCGPCRILEPTGATIATDTDAAIAKVDIDAHQDIAREYRVQSVPTLQLFAGGEPVEQLVGVQDEGTLRSLVDRHA